MNNKLVSIGDDRYYILGTIKVDCGFDTNKLKSMWGLSDTILRNGDEYFICMKIIDVEFIDKENE
jgi:hypothetical protein